MGSRSISLRAIIRTLSCVLDGSALLHNWPASCLIRGMLIATI